MTTCPVRLTREAGVSPAIEIFDQCHQLRVDRIGGGVQYERVGWPVAGGVVDQPAIVLDDFRVIEEARLVCLRAGTPRRPRRRQASGSTTKDTRPRTHGRRRRH